LTKKFPNKAPKEGVVTSIVYKTRDIPAALFKSLTGFATAGTNIIKLESFVPMARHTDAHFYLEFEGNPQVFPHSVAVEELQNYTRSFEILGTYPKSPYRRKFNGQ
jgi:prephenate dehydratase